MLMAKGSDLFKESMAFIKPDSIKKLRIKRSRELFTTSFPVGNSHLEQKRRQSKGDTVSRRGTQVRQQSPLQWPRCSSIPVYSSSRYLLNSYKPLKYCSGALACQTHPQTERSHCCLTGDSAHDSISRSSSQDTPPHCSNHSLLCAQLHRPQME